MIRFRHGTDKAMGYRCKLEEILGRTSVIAKFDTGADYTIVTANALSLNRQQIERLNTFIQERNCTKKSFMSASGHIMDGFLSYSSNVLFAPVCNRVGEIYLPYSPRAPHAAIAANYHTRPCAIE